MPPSRRALACAAFCSAALSASLVASPAAAEEAEGFHFGSYGRVRTATDLQGGGPQYSNLVAHGSRLDLDPYLELELRNTQYPEKDNKDLRVRVVSTLAVAGDPFHYTGQWEANTAMRNMFVDVRGVGHKALTLWVGARMYRGDDIYLLDYWPLDNLNTVGGGGGIDVGSGTRVQLHVGTNRLLGTDFQYQARMVPSRDDFGADLAVTLDRPRTIASTKITQFFNGFTAPAGFKASLYAEGHYLPSGTLETSETTVRPAQELPADTGFVIGGQATGYGFGERDTHVHLFLRYARGVAAYGELASPTALNTNKKSSASELLIATAGNYEIDRFSVMMGAYARLFKDGTDAEYSANTYWEGIFSTRPQVFLTEHTGVGAELSYQFKNRKILDDEGRHRVPAAWRVSLLPMITPMGWGSYKRPILYGVYTATFRNQAAQDSYPVEDPRADRSMEHYLGMHAEWWFNSSSYP
jgi:LamB porin